MLAISTLLAHNAAPIYESNVYVTTGKVVIDMGFTWFLLSVFGTGNENSINSPGISGAIYNPTDCVFDSTEQYLYVSDQGGNMLRKLAVTATAVNSADPNFNVIYGVKTVFPGYDFVLFSS